MSNSEEIWREKSDQEILESASCIFDYTEEARQVIIVEAKRRGLHVAPLTEVAASIRNTPKKTGFITKCAHCGNSLLFGGIREGNSWFCDQECRSQSIHLAVSHQIPDSIVTDRLWSLHRGDCPRCGRSGPVDVHTSYRVWSVFILTFSSKRPQVSCARCGTRSLIKNSAFSLLFGWWGLPWGPIMTLTQISRNMSLLIWRGDGSGPSGQLERIVRLRLGAEFFSPPPGPLPQRAEQATSQPASR